MTASPVTPPSESGSEAKPRSGYSFNPPPLADDWVQWIVGDWEGAGGSEAGEGTSVTRIELALNGQFLISREEASLRSLSADQKNYLRRNMHATDEEIERFGRLPYRAFELYSIDEKTGEVVGFLFDSLRCIATGRGRREGMRETIHWEWLNGHRSTRITERVCGDRMRVTQRTPMPDGSEMEEAGEAVRRAPMASADGREARDVPEGGA